VATIASPQVTPCIYVVSGPTAAGKTTAARLLAQRFDQAVHLAGDGSLAVTATADRYADDGYTVVIDDVIPPLQLGQYRTALRSRPCHVIVLLPTSVIDRYDVFAVDEPRVGLWLDTTAMTPAETVDAILAATSTTPEPIVISEYDAAWPRRFHQLAAPLRAAVVDIGGQVEHVGSTSVPGLAAKPIIDIDVIVPTPQHVPAVIERLRGLGFTYQGDKGIAGREAFLWPAGAEPHHVYVVVAGSDPHVAHIRFRDLLRHDPDAVAEYVALKRELAVRYQQDRLGYTDAKTDFIVSLLKRDPA
jgi:GrpB-like predicted nucleotidyltransferase (UPF0157 family)